MQRRRRYHTSDLLRLRDFDPVYVGLGSGPCVRASRERCKTFGRVVPQDEFWEGTMKLRLPRRHFLHLAASATALPIMPHIAKAQAYPTRPITMVVPFPPGGPVDTIGRIVADRMKVSLDQPIIIENVPGASGSIGVGRAVRAAPDGYTLSIGSSGSHLFTGAVYALPWDLLKDLEPVVLLAGEPQLILGKKTMPATDLRELVAWLKANPDKASAGTQGVGSVGHMDGIFFQKMTGTRFQFVPYRGSGPATQDLMAGQIDIYFDSPVATLPQVRAGTIKAYAVMAKSRMAAAPEIPTVDEAGLTGLYVSNWRAIWVPMGTPKDIIAKLNAAAVEALADATVRARLAEIGQEVPPPDQQTPKALGEFQRAEAEKWWPIIKAANVRAE